MRDTCEAGAGKGIGSRSAAPSLLRGEAKPPRWPPTTHIAVAWAVGASELDSGIVWFSQAEGLRNKSISLLAILPRSPHFVHKDKFLFFILKKNEFLVTSDFYHEEQ